MNKSDLTPVICQEECAEVIQAISKCFRFGLKQTNNYVTNKEHLETELGQLAYSMQKLIDDWKLDEANIEMAYNNKELTQHLWEEFFPK